MIQFFNSSCDTMSPGSGSMHFVCMRQAAPVIRKLSGHVCIHQTPGSGSMHFVCMRQTAPVNPELVGLVELPLRRRWIHHK